MIAILGFILAILSVVALIDPKTPFGKKILRIPFIKNDILIQFYPVYKYFIFTISIIIIFIILYLIMSVYDFYLTQSFVLGTLYLGVISLFFILIHFVIRGKSFKTEIIIQLLSIFKKYMLLLFVFISLASLLTFFLKKNIENGEIEKLYLKIKLNKTSEQLLKLTDTTALQFRNRYAKEINLISNINLINQYKKKYNFQYNLEKKLDTTQKRYSNLINKTKIIYNSNEYSDVFNLKIKELEKLSQNIKSKPLHLFPVEMQPYFLTSLIVSKQSTNFASLAVGSKIYLINLYNLTIELFGTIGLIIFVILLSLISFWLTFKLAKYNKKYSKKNTNNNNYFFIWVSIFGCFLAILGLM